MDFRPTAPSGSAARPGRCRAAGGFTLAEVLAALALMAIVLPVAIQGLRTAAMAGETGLRKSVAARIGDRILSELASAGQWSATSQNGTVEEDAILYRWTVKTEPWVRDTMRQVSIRVRYPVQGLEQEVHLSTLVDTGSATTATP